MDVVIEAIKMNNIHLITEILKDNPKIISGTHYFEVVKLIKGTKMTSVVLELVGHELIKYYKNHAISILTHAINEGKDLKIIEMIVSFNTDTINHVSYDGSTPLLNAVKMDKSINVIKYLISKKGGVNRCNNGGQSPLHFARNTAVMKLLIQSGANVNCIDNSGSTPLMTLMTLLKDKKDLLYLFQHGADANIYNIEGQNALHLALKLKIDCGLVLKILDRIDAVHLNSEDKMGYTPLYYAFENFPQLCNKNKLIFELINKGCKVSEKVFMSALKYNGYSEIVKKLVDYIDVKDCIDSKGRNVLHVVLDVNIVNVLVRKGALINHRDNNGITPLTEAVNSFKDVEIIESLLSYGAEVYDSQCFVDLNYLNRTSILHGNSVVDLLVLYGMNVCSKNQYITDYLTECFTSSNQFYSVFLICECSLLRHIFISNENIKFPEILSTGGYTNFIIDHFKSEFHKMKRINIIDDVSFYNFCLSEHKLLRCCIDESKCKYVRDDYKKLKEYFPTFFSQIIIKIKINFKIQKRRELLNKLLYIYVKSIVKEPVYNIDVSKLSRNTKDIVVSNFIVLNWDCLCIIGNYLLDHELKCLLAASI